MAAALRSWAGRRLGWLALAAALLAPFVDASPYALSVLTSAALFAMLAVGLNIVVGYCGLLDLGYAAFFAIGAYTSGVLSTRWDWPLLATVPVVVAASVVAGVVIGGPTLRLRSDYLAIVTLGFGEIIRITANNLPITGGPSGIYGIPGPSLFGLDLGSPVALYFTVVVVVALAVVAAGRLGRSRSGRRPHLQGQAGRVRRRSHLGRPGRCALRRPAVGRLPAELHVPAVGPGAHGRRARRDGLEPGRDRRSRGDQRAA